jgi:hypothetical protein
LKFGTLQVFPRQGLLREHALELPSAVVGRGEGSAILIDDFSVARRHARLTVDSGRLLLEDLGSASGTFVDGERLEPGVRHLVSEGASIHFGEIEAKYLPPEAQDLPGEDAIVSGLNAGVGLAASLASPFLPIEPGKQAAATLSIVNGGRLVDTVRVEVVDLPPDWYVIDTPTLALLPGGRADVQVTLRPPRRFDSTAGRYTFTVRVISREYDTHPEATGEFDVLAFESAEISLEAIRSKKNFRLLAENHGNDPVRYELAGRDEEQAFRYWFETPAIELQPGEKRLINLSVRRHAQFFGTRQQLPFEVIGTSGSGAAISARGQLAVNPPLQKFKMPTLFALTALLLAASAIAVLVLTDNGAKKANAEDQFAGVHLCDSANAKADQDKKNAQAANQGAVAGATVVGAGDAAGHPIFGQADSNGAPFFAQNDPRWGSEEYAKSTQLPNGKDWCGTTIAQCGCAMTSVSVMLALYGLLQMPDGTPLSPKALNDWFNGDAKRTDRGWVSRGYIYGDVIWTSANELSAQIAKINPNARTVRFAGTGDGSDDDIRTQLQAGRPIILEVPGHWIAAVGLDGDKILINDPYYRDRKTLDAYAGKVRSSVHFEPSSDLSAVVITAPADVQFKVTDKQGRVVATGAGTLEQPKDQINQIPGASLSAKHAWRDPTCIQQAPPPGAGTNQVILPGSPDDYVVEIVGTGGQPGALAIHTYGKDGTATIATVEGPEGTQADLSYDPNAAKPVINVNTNGTPQATTTPQPGGGAGGGDETTPTPASGGVPTIVAPTPTPFIEQRTAMTLSADPGQTRVEVATNSGFELGDPIRFAPGLPNEEDNIIVGFGSFILATPLKFAHSPGEPILRLQRPPGQGPGLPPGITPPPATGPITPPTEVQLNCSTLYQQSPKQATFVCDATINGGYTNTRWTLNGKIVDDFTGATSFLWAFNTDTPASVGITVCNQTLCRSTTRNDKITFPLPGTNGGSGAGPNNAAGTGTGGAAGGTGQSSPVAVVCATQFPVTPDGQVAQFDCTVNFQGDYTSISWSAPGGTPANKSGASKTFTTTIKNAPGAPVSLKVSATVCNFGVCKTSTPSDVGIGRTATIIESSPTDAVNQGHKLTLMARVQGIGKVIPQGGTVQFFADTFEIGPAATLFTVGNVAVAQVAVDTDSLGVATHQFKALYSGGTNAFGSVSDPRDIQVLPPAPDDCDSINNDRDLSTPPDEVTDGTCNFSTPKDLGAGTIVTNLALNGQTGDGRNSIVVAPGSTFSISGNVARSTYCPGCIRQLYFGIGANTTAGTPAQGPYCVVSGVLPEASATVLGPGYSFALQAPSVPGVYYLRASTTLDYFCVGPPVGPPENSVARIVVQQDVKPTLDVRNEAGDAPITGVSEGQKVTLFSTVPAGITGRVVFTAFQPDDPVNGNGTPDPVSLPNAGTAQICPPSGELRTTGVAAAVIVIPCTPGEARLLTDNLPGLRGALTVTAKYVDPDPLVLKDAISGVATTVQIRRAPQNCDPFDPLFLLPCTTPDHVELKVLAATKVITTTNATTTPVQMGSDFTVTAHVESANATLGLLGGGGTVQFHVVAKVAGVDVDVPFGGPVAVSASGDATLTWRAGVNPPSCVAVACGGFPFDRKDDSNRSLFDKVFAVYTNGGTSFLQSACDPSDGSDPKVPESANCVLGKVDIDPASSSVVVSSVTPGTPTAGQQITIVATVTGVPDFPPAVAAALTPSTVSFSVTGGNGSTDQGSLGSADVVEGPAGVFTATLQFTTGTSGDQMDTPGNYQIRAVFSGTTGLDSSTSADFPVTLGKESAGVALTVTGAGACSPPDTATYCVNAGTAALGHVVVTASNTANIDNNSANIEIFDGASSLAVHNLAGSDNGVFDFNLGVLLNPGTFNLRADYSGNNFYQASESAPSDCSTGCISIMVKKSSATITLDNLQTTNDRAPAGTQSVADQFSIRARVNYNQTVSAAGGDITLKATISGTTTTLATHTLSSNDLGEFTFALDTSTGVLLTTSQIDLSIDYSGNTRVGAASLATPVSLTLAKANPSVSVTLNPTTVTIGGSTAVSFSVTGVGGVDPTCPTATPNCLDLRIGSATGTLITSIAMNGTFNSLPTGGASGTCLDHPTTTPPCAIFVVYSGDTFFNGANNSGNLSIRQATPTVEIVASDVTINGNSSVTVTVTAPSGISPNCTGCISVSASTATGAPKTILSNLDYPANGSFTVPTGSGATGAYAGTCLTSAGTCALTVTYNGNTDVAAGTDSDTFTISKVTSSVALNLGVTNVTAGTAIAATATVTLGNGASPACTNCLEFRLGSTTGTLLGSASVAADGTASISLATGGNNSLDVGSRTVYAVYPSTSTIAQGSDSKSVTIDKIDVTVSISSSAASYAKNTNVTINVTIAPGSAPGTICLRYVGTATCLDSKTVSSGSMTLVWNSPNQVGSHDLEVHYTTSNNDYTSPIDSNTLTIDLT